MFSRRERGQFLCSPSEKLAKPCRLYSICRAGGLRRLRRLRTSPRPPSADARYMSLKRTLLYGAGLAVVLGGPLSLFTDHETPARLWRQISGSFRTSAAEKAPEQSDPAALPVAAMPPIGSPLHDNLPPPSLDEALRFDATVDWVTRRWPRVSTGLPHLQLQGYRVPLVTGSALSDVAGSLTYYFNAQQQVQRITLRGTTGDPRALAALAVERFGFVRRLTNDPGLALYEIVDANNRLTGELKIRTARVVRASQPYAKYEIDFSMDRPQ
jgi:hypothetical protein